VDFDTPNARNASGRGGRTAAFNFYEIPDNLPPGISLAEWCIHRTHTSGQERMLGLVRRLASAVPFGGTSRSDRRANHG